MDKAQRLREILEEALLYRDMGANVFRANAEMLLKDMLKLLSAEDVKHIAVLTPSTSLDIRQYVMEGRGPGMEEEMERWAGDGSSPVFLMVEPDDDIVYYVSKEPFSVAQVRDKFGEMRDEEDDEDTTEENTVACPECAHFDCVCQKE